MRRVNLKIVIGVLAALLVVVLLIDVIANFQREEEVLNVDNINDKTWSESSIFTNVEYQKEQEEEIKEEYEAFDYSYTLDNPFVKTNPYNINPLTAYVIFENDKPVKYSYDVIDEENGLDFIYSNDKYSKTVVVPVIGLFENANNKVKITVEDENGITSINTIDIPITKVEYNPVITNVEGELEDEILNGWYFDSFYNAFDTSGNIRYNLNVGVEDNYMKFYDNHIFVKVNNYQTIYEINAMGKILAEYETPSAEYNFHHDLVKTDEGVVYALGSYNVDLPDIPYSESFIFEYDKPGKPSRIIDVHDLFFENLVSYYGTPNQNDMIHLNSIDYIKEENELIVSSQAQSFIAAINIETEGVDWLIQDEEGAIQNKDKLLEVVNFEDFEKTSGQHTAFLTNNSKYDDYRSEDDYIISIFNNNNCKNYEGELQLKKYSDAPNQELCTYNVSDVLIYDVNVKDMTVEQIDSYTINDEYAPIMSSVFDVGDDFIVHYNQGSTPKSFLINNNGDILIEFNVQDYDGNGYYRTNFLTQSELINLVGEASND